MKRILTLIVLLGLSLAAGAQSPRFKLGKWTEIQTAILQELSRSYVDSLPIDRIERRGIDAMLENLDPYTVYIPEEENENLQMMINRTYGGIGAVIYKPDVQGNVIITFLGGVLIFKEGHVRDKALDMLLMMAGITLLLFGSW